MREEKVHHVLALVLLGLLGERAVALHCYSDYCKNMSELAPTPGYQCVLTPVQKDKACADFKFEDVDETKRDNTAIFTLSAYVQDLGNSERATAFNLSVSNINFHRLFTRYQYIEPKDSTQYSNKGVGACRHVELYGNSSHPAPQHLYVSCPFSDDMYEDSPYRLEYIVVGDDFVYTGKYVFYVPQHRYITDGVALNKYTPFFYVDVSNSALYVQPLPPSYNVTKYRMWLISNNTKSSFYAIFPANENGGHIRYNFIASQGLYYVKVAALHPDCGKYGCVNSTSPFIHISKCDSSIGYFILKEKNI